MPTSSLSALGVRELTAAPATPGTGDHVIYPKTDGKWYTKNSAGTEVEVVRGNDARLSDARTPTAHTHPASDLTATGTRDATTFLRGDNTWAPIAGAVAASETVAGVVELATAAETATGADTLRAVTPAALKPLLDAKAASAHTHAQADINGLGTSLAGKVDTSRTISAGTGLTGGGDLTANRTLTVAYGTTAGTAAQGNDARLSDARTPLAHTHAQSDVTGLTTALDTKIPYGGIVMNTNPFGGKQLWINSINDAMFRAADRWTVTGNFHSKSTDAVVGAISQAQLRTLFDGDYEGGLTIPAGQYALINLNFNGGTFSGYPYGAMYFSHYYSSFTESISVRVNTTFAAHGIGWSDIATTEYVNNGSTALIRRAPITKYAPSDYEFKMVAPDATNAIVTEINWQLDRPGNDAMPLVDKYRVNTLYSDLLWGSSTAPTARVNASGSAEFTGSVSVDGSSLVKTNDTRLSDARTPTAHNHPQADVNGLGTSLAGKVDTSRTISAGTGLTGGGDLSANRTLTVVYGTTSGTAAQGNDSRLSDARTPSGSAGGDLGDSYPNPSVRKVTVPDTRAVDDLPQSGSKQVSWAFKQSSTVGIGDGSTYCLVHYMRSYTDTSAGLPMQIAYTDAGNTYQRRATAIATNTWGAWVQIGKSGQSNIFENDARLTDARTPTAHTHAQGDISGLTTALADKVPDTRQIIGGTGLTGGGDLSANRTLNVTYGTTAGTAAQGNDSRLSDARTPTAHSHPTSDVTGLDAKLVTRNRSRLAGTSITGGGNVTWIGGYLKWTNRLIIMGAYGGYADVNMPASGVVIAGMGTHAGTTVNASGIQLPGWNSLWWDMANSVFRIGTYNLGTYELPDSFILIATHNGDLGFIRFADSRIIEAGYSSTDASPYQMYPTIVKYTTTVPARPLTSGIVIWQGTADPATNALAGDSWWEI